MSVTAIKASKADKGTDSDEGKGKKEKKGGKKKLLIIVAAVLVVAGAAYWFVLKPSGGAEEGPKPGLIVALEPTQINLASGHYLKLGIALQLVEGASEEVDGSKALDATIDLFSGQDVADISKEETRKALKRKLGSELEERYDGEVLGVYFTEFVTQ